ncbi:tape measure protein [Moraxella bovis]|uniref:tape measure protein n=1 Tax=Moraxella bovis TaxID=476 RepID=UPI002226EB52|nr:tape measure protein [Moraxella bovis]UZA07447.1 tape measure protein [Moraxella bovis]UZA10317.1 tape measure protein [Moraxella bovis]
MSNLDFNVQLTMATARFNQAVQTVMRNTAGMQTRLTQAVEAIQENSNKAGQAVKGLLSADDDKLVETLKNATTTINKLGAGARFNATELSSAMTRMESHVQGLNTSLAQARAKLDELKVNNGTKSDIKAVEKEIKTLETAIKNANIASEEFAVATSGAMGRVGKTAESARHSLYSMLNIRTSGTIQAEIDGINNELEQLRRSGTLTGDEMARVTQHAERKIADLRKEMARTSHQSNVLGQSARGVGVAFNGLVGLLGALGISLGAMELIQLAERFNRLEASVRLATGGGVDFITAMQGIADVANSTYNDLENVGELFTRLSRAGGELGLTQQQLLGITKTINQAMQVSGGSAESMDAALTQLIQGLQSGVLRGEEFNSVMEQSPRLARALADGLGVGIGQLRAMAGEGKLTAETVIQAIQSQSAVIEAEFAQMPVTVSSSLTVLKNKFLSFVGELDGQLQQSNAISDFIMSIANGFDSIDPNMIASIKEAFSQLGELAKTFVGNVNDTAETLSKLWGAFDGTAQAGEQISLITRLIDSLSMSIAFVSDSMKVLDITSRAFLGAVVNGLGVVIAGFEKLFRLETEIGKTLMQQADDLWRESHEKAMAFESSMMKVSENIAKSSQDHLNETAELSRQTYERMVSDYGTSQERINEAHLQAIQDRIKANKGEIDAVSERELAEKGLQAVISETGEISLQEHAYIKDSLIETAYRAKEAGVAFNDAFDISVARAKTEQDLTHLSEGLHVLARNGVITAEQLNTAMVQIANQSSVVQAKNDELIQGFATFAQQVIASGDAVKISALESQASMQGLTFTMGENGSFMLQIAEQSATGIKSAYKSAATALSVDMESASLSVSQGFSDNRDKLLTLAQGFDNLKENGLDASNVIVQGLNTLTEQAKNTAELEELIRLWQQMGSQGKISAEQMASGLEVTQGKLDKLKDGVNSVTEAYKLMGLQSKAELQKHAQEMSQSYQMIKKSGTATAETLAQAWKKQAEAQIRANDGVADSVLQVQAKQHGFAVQVDKDGKATITTQEEVKKAVDGVSDSTERVASSASRAGQAMIDGANKAKSSWDSLKESVDGAVKAAQKANVTKTHTTQLGTATGIENFLKQAGVDEQTAMQTARRLMNGVTNGDPYENIHKMAGMMGFKGSRYAGASTRLLHIAEQLRYRKADTQAIQAADVIEPQKTVNVNIKQGGQTINTSIPAGQENTMMEFLKQLENGKALSGR